MVQHHGFHFNYLYLVFYFICFVGIILQLLLLIAFIVDPLKCFKNLGTYFVANLAVADAMACLVTPFSVSSSFSTLHFFITAFSTMSCITIASISLDRFLLVAYPVKHRFLMKRKATIVWLVFIWLVSFVYPVKRLVTGYTEHEELVIVFIGIIFALFTAVVYAMTYFNLKRQYRNIALAESGSRALASRILKEKRFLNTIIIIACVAVVCIVPGLIFSQVVLLNGVLLSRLAYQTLGGLCLTLYDINFAVNPLIYIIRLPNYRKTFSILYCKRRVSR